MRFKDFQEEWKKERIGKYINEVRFYTSNFEKYPLFTFSIENGVTPKTDRYERGFLVKKEGDTFKVIQKKQFLINPMNLRFGAINYSKIEEPVSVSGYYDIFEIENKSNNDFWLGLLSNNKALKMYNSISTGSLIEKKRVHFSQLINVKFYLPSFSERKKISLFLALINQRIVTQNKIIEEYQTLKNCIFDAIILKSRKIGICKINKIIEEYNVKTTIDNEYPVLSSTASGIYFQNEYFNKEAASENTTGYKCVPKGYCTYRSMSDTGRFYFNIQNITDIGIVSPAYPVFSVIEDSALFLVSVLNSDKTIINEILKLKAGGTRFSLPFKKLIELEVPWPENQTRKHFMKIIKNIIQKINLEQKILTKYIDQKNYLLNNMFI